MVSDTATVQIIALCGIGIFAGALIWWSLSPTEVGISSATLVGIRSRHNHMYLEVSPVDGLLRASANTTKSPAARFRMLTIAPATVERLRTMSVTFEEAGNEAGRTGNEIHTRSGCKCTGFSNEHGFGRYCHAWEEQWQDAWCYVADTCNGRSVRKGSFGRRHDVCTSAPYPSPPPSPPPMPPNPPPPPEPLKAPPFDPRKAKGVWVAPPDCQCSGFSNRHGFGAYCSAWERKLAPTQIPWCYVDDNCTTAIKRGSFGRKHTDCILVSAPPPPPKRSSWLFGRRLTTVPHPNNPFAHAALYARYNRSNYVPPARPYLSKQQAKSHAHEREEVVLLKKVDRLRRKYVAFVSEVTHGFLSVEMPPHKQALHPTALTDKLSLQSIFALLPSGHLAALGTNSLLNLCDPKTPERPNSYSSTTRYNRDAVPAATPVPGQGGPTVCTGYHANKKDGHYKLLRVTTSTTAEFSFMRL